MIAVVATALLLLPLSAWGQDVKTIASQIPFEAWPWVAVGLAGGAFLLWKAGLVRLPSKAPAPFDDDEHTQSRAIPAAARPALTDADQAELARLRQEDAERRAAAADAEKRAAWAAGVVEQLTPRFDELLEHLTALDRRVTAMEEQQGDLNRGHDDMQRSLAEVRQILSGFVSAVDTRLTPELQRIADRLQP